MCAVCKDLLCFTYYRIVNQGFPLKKDGIVNSASQVPRIPVSSSFLLELTHGAYFAMYNEFYTLALQAIKDIDRRATYELLPDAMLVTSALLNSLETNASGE